MYVKKLKVKKSGNSYIVQVDKELLDQEVTIFDKEAFDSFMQLGYQLGRGSKQKNELL